MCLESRCVYRLKLPLFISPSLLAFLSTFSNLEEEEKPPLIHSGFTSQWCSSRNRDNESESIITSCFPALF